MIAIPRHTVDLTAYPDLVVIYLGMQVRSLRGLATFLQLGPEIDKSVAARPDGLLCHERIYYSLFPLHAGMRQYWRDFESLEKWTRELPHQRWWKKFLSAPLGVTFDTPEEIRARAARIQELAVSSTAMPLGNATKMTQAERDLLGQWISQGARIK